MSKNIDIFLSFEDFFQYFIGLKYSKLYTVLFFTSLLIIPFSIYSSNHFLFLIFFTVFILNLIMGCSFFFFLKFLIDRYFSIKMLLIENKKLGFSLKDHVENYILENSDISGLSKELFFITYLDNSKIDDLKITSKEIFFKYILHF